MPRARLTLESMTTVEPNELPVHPFADLLPRLTEQELDELTADIAQRGQREAATVWSDGDGQSWLLDGRHRAQAVSRLGLPLRAEHFDGSEDEARALVVSLNLRRRHLTSSQRALAAAALSTRQRGGAAGLPSQSVGLPVAPTQAEAARMAGVSERTVRDGVKIMTSGDAAMIDAVAAGDLTVSAAAKLMRGDKTDRQAATALFMEHRRGSASDQWLTPRSVLERAEACLGRIDGDVAAAPERNVDASWWLTEDDDALAAPSWANPDGSPSRLWVNPPYGAGGRGPGDWTRRVVAEWEAGTVDSALLLLPARPGAHWQQALARFPRLEFRGHLTFEPGSENPARAHWDSGKRSEAPFASILIGIGVEATRLHAHFGDLGVVFVSYSVNG